MWPFESRLQRERELEAQQRRDKAIEEQRQRDKEDQEWRDAARWADDRAAEAKAIRDALPRPPEPTFTHADEYRNQLDIDLGKCIQQLERLRAERENLDLCILHTESVRQAVEAALDMLTMKAPVAEEPPMPLMDQLAAAIPDSYDEIDKALTEAAKAAQASPGVVKGGKRGKKEDNRHAARADGEKGSDVLNKAHDDDSKFHDELTKMLASAG